MDLSTRPSRLARVQQRERVRAGRFDPAIVAVFAAVVCAAGAARPSLWFDEAATISASTRSVPELWRLIHNIDAVHGVYYLAMHAWFAIFPATEFWSRLSSCLAVGIAAAGVVVVSKQFSTRTVSVCAGIVFAILPRITWAGIEARSYALTAAAAVWLTVLVVAVTDESYRFDEIADGYDGPLYLEVVPLSFTVRVERGPLAQPAAVVGRAAPRSTDDDVPRRPRATRPCCSTATSPVPADELALGDGLFLEPRPARRRRWVASATGRASNAPLLDMAQPAPVDPGTVLGAGARARRATASCSTPRALLPADVATRRCAIPPDLAAEMTAYDPTSGELRTHYAGFFDPGFGYDARRRAPRLAGRARGARPRRAVHDRARPTRSASSPSSTCSTRPTRSTAHGIGSNYQGQDETLEQALPPPAAPRGRTAPPWRLPRPATPRR